jgi:hypothetical protein
MSRDELLARLHACADFDAVIERLGEADYGCEELLAGANAPVWVLLLLKDGSEKSLEVSESRLNALHLDEGSLCSLAALESGI